ncbi:MAG: HTH domain-containing protein, partial [Candidatus Omnitrophica bacterium]|nr:HTH domain-containing protein [Candidatus Omnitrophota bacterium]
MIDLQARKSLLQILELHNRSNPIKAATLAAQIGVSLRDINESIRQLRKTGLLIGSSKEPPYGYYIPANEQEAREYLNSFKAELFDMLATYNRQKRAKQSYLDDLRTNDLFKPKFNES